MSTKWPYARLGSKRLEPCGPRRFRNGLENADPPSAPAQVHSKSVLLFATSGSFIATSGFFIATSGFFIA